MLSAPAGWGKTAALAEWAAATPMTVAWVSLEGDDDTAGRFFRILIAALDRVHPLRFDDVASQLLSSSSEILEEMEAVLLDRLQELPGTTAIVLDDVHELRDRDIWRSFSRLIERLPSTVRVVVASRGELRFPLARLRSAGDITVFRAPDLAFGSA